MELPEGFPRVLAGTVFLAICLLLLLGLATWLTGKPWDTRAERLAPVAFLLPALLLPKVYTWLIRPPESGLVRQGKPRVRYQSVLGYATLATVVVWAVTLTFRWFFPFLRKTSNGIFLLVGSIIALLIHHFALVRDGSRMEQ